MVTQKIFDNIPSRSKPISTSSSQPNQKGGSEAFLANWFELSHLWGLFLYKMRAGVIRQKNAQKNKTLQRGG
jgi:hypothetical protein